MRVGLARAHRVGSLGRWRVAAPRQPALVKCAHEAGLAAEAFVDRLDRDACPSRHGADRRGGVSAFEEGATRHLEDRLPAPLRLFQASTCVIASNVLDSGHIRYIVVY
jgi:hypothetical protein